VAGKFADVAKMSDTLVLYNTLFGVNLAGLSLNKHAIDVGSPPPPLRVCKSIHTEGKSYSNLSSSACYDKVRQTT